MNNLKYEYVGRELDLFANAQNWKAYFSSMISHYIGKYVLEVGAGIGETTRILCTEDKKEWVCLEPDHNLALRIRLAIEEQRIPGCCEVVVGTTCRYRRQEIRYDTLHRRYRAS